MFDSIDTNVISDRQKHRIVDHIKDGEFLSNTGLFSISRLDTHHWDLEDVDWGGGGQYCGHPSRVIEYLLRRKIRPDIAYNILSRIISWADVAPYIPQEQFGQFFGTPHVEMPMSLAGAAFTQTIIFGVFGLNPRLDGSLVIDPSYDSIMGKFSSLQNYRFKTHSYDVRLFDQYYEVYGDGKFLVKNMYGKAYIIK